jgi:hypothetical protein
MWNTIKRIFKSVFIGIATTVIVGIYAIAFIIAAFFSPIYYYIKNK